MEINRKDFYNTLQSVSAGVAQKELIEQSGSFIFMGGNVFTFNDEIAVSAPVEFKEEGAVPAKEFMSFIEKLKTETIDISIKGTEVGIVGKKAKAGLRFSKEILLPIKDIKIPKKWNDVATNFVDALKACLNSVSKDRSKPILMCISIQEDCVESSDSFRLTQHMLDTEMFSEDVLIPATSAKALLDCNPVKCGKTKGWLHFKDKDGLVFSCRYLDETFPDTDHLIIREGAEITFPDSLPDMLARAAALNDMSDKVRITLEKNVLTVSVSGSVGWFEESAKTPYKEKPVSFEITADYLTSMLKVDAQIIFTGRTMEFITDDCIHVVMVFPAKKK